mgnify:CR=1 FL=1
MAFSNLRNGNTIYVLHKENTPILELGKIISVSQPKYNNMYNPEMVVDISATVNGQNVNF